MYLYWCTCLSVEQPPYVSFLQLNNILLECQVCGWLTFKLEVLTFAMKRHVWYIIYFLHQR